VPRRAFTLVELLVTMAVIVVLVALFGGALSAARNNSQAGATRSAIARLDQVMMAALRSYEWRSVPGAVVNGLTSQIPNPAAARAWHIRRNLISTAMPDRWSDVAYMAANQAEFNSGPQSGYIGFYNSTNPTSQYGGAECLFMVLMQGGLADCLDCNGLQNLKKGDKDGDGALEFWDDWNNPIDFILWAPGFQVSGGTDLFFTGLDAAFPATGSVRPSLGMRPLIYSAGPDGEYGLERNGDAATLSRGSSPAGRDCGNPEEQTTKTSGGPAASSGYRDDNIVNVEMEGSS
jgi:prepilin-type N-terminal cleavage/methylation domain-containing protein